MRILIRIYRKEINETNDVLDNNYQMNSDVIQGQNQNSNVSINNYELSTNHNIQTEQNQNNSNLNN